MDTSISVSLYVWKTLAFSSTRIHFIADLSPPSQLLQLDFPPPASHDSLEITSISANTAEIHTASDVFDI